MTKINVTENNERTGDLSGFLAKRLPTNRIDLEKALREAETRCITALTARIEAQSELYMRREQYRHPKDKEMTDFDRKTQLDSNTREYQIAYELAAGFEKLLEQRVEVIKTLLS